jgi:serine/threonine-protein kinase RsbW
VTIAVNPNGGDPVSDGAAGLSRLQFTLCLARRAVTVRMVRRLVDTALSLMYVADDCRAEIALALTEACANAVYHAQGTEYQVTVDIGPDRCILEVIDSGVGFDHHCLDGVGIDGDLPHVAAERGRGLRIIRAYTDALQLRTADPHGLAVRMTKNLIRTTDADA